MLLQEILEPKVEQSISVTLKVNPRSRSESKESSFSESIENKATLNEIFAEHGENIAWMMKYLEEELSRLFEERRIHAFAMLAEKERQKLETAEAEYRKKERNEEQVNDNQEKTIVNEYLEKLIVQEFDFTSYDETSMYIEKVSRKIAKEANEQVFNESLDSKLIQSTVKEFLIPEIFKRIERKKKEKTFETRYNTLDSLIDGILQKHFGQPSLHEETLMIVIEMLDIIIDNSIMAYEASETSSDEDEGKYEARMAIKKILRSFCPKRTWKTSTERIAEATVDDILSSVMEDFEVAQKSGAISEKLSEILKAFSQAYTNSSTESEDIVDFSPILSEHEHQSNLSSGVTRDQRRLSKKESLNVRFKEPRKGHKLKKGSKSSFK